MTFARPTRGLSILALLCGAFAFNACATDPEADETEDVVSDSEEAVSYSCNESSDTGYTNGKATPITLVTVQGRRIEISTADAYMAMADAAARAGVIITITSAFRTNAEQQYLYNCYKNKNCNNGSLAAAPGYSNHQSGHALDLNTASPGVYNWLVANAAAYGFKRTVPSELWHWEWWGGGPGTNYCKTCDRSAAGFTFSCDGVNKGATCVSVDEPADMNSWADNYMCTATPIGLEWSNKGPIAGKRCVNVTESADDVPAAWADNFLCVPSDSEYILEWSSAGPIAGKSCLNWNESADKGTWNDNFLCISGTADFREGPYTFSSDGKNDAQTCVSVDEPADKNSWADNYFCSDQDIGARWSSAGPIDGMQCTNIAEIAEHDPAIWADNFLCLPNDSKLRLAWSTAGRIAGETCVRWYESADATGSWADNYLCITEVDDKGAPITSSGSPSKNGASGTANADDSFSEPGCSATPSKRSDIPLSAFVIAAASVVGYRRNRRQKIAR